MRPLYDDKERNSSALTRDYVLNLNAAGGKAPLLSVFGGKITTYRRLAERALEKLAPFLRGRRGPWTIGSILPGGDLPNGDPAGFAHDLSRDYPFLGTAAALRLAHSYGSDATCILASARRTEDLGRGFGYGFSERELDWLVKKEWALTGEDVLWRRSKLGLHLDSDATRAIVALLTGCRVAR